MAPAPAAALLALAALLLPGEGPAPGLLPDPEFREWKDGVPAGWSAEVGATSELPNGVVVHYSRWISLLPDGSPLEGRGVPPDVVVEHRGGGDPAFARALEILEEAAVKAGR